jgi:hypothetical protein
MSRQILLEFLLAEQAHRLMNLKRTLSGSANPGKHLPFCLPTNYLTATMVRRKKTPTLVCRLRDGIRAIIRVMISA